jgi:hypothetical protein
MVAVITRQAAKKGGVMRARFLITLCSALLLLTACPETTPPEATPGGDAPGAGGPGEAGAPPGEGAAGPMGKRPEEARFTVVEGEGVVFSGTVSYPGDKKGSIRLDFLTQEGNQPPNLVHAVSLPKLGDFSVELPKDYGQLHVVAFIDVDGDGPNASDPAALATLTVGVEPITGVALALSDTPDLGALTPGSNGAAPGEGAPPGEGGAAAPPTEGATPPAEGATPPAEGAAAPAAPAAGG